MTRNLLFEKFVGQRKNNSYKTRGLFKLGMTLRQKDWMIGRKSVAYKEMRMKLIPNKGIQLKGK
jgi:hypothetical protein